MADYRSPPPWPDVEKMNKATKRFVNDLKRLFGPEGYKTRFVHILGSELGNVLTTDDWMQVQHVINNWLFVSMRGQSRNIEGQASGLVLQLVAVDEDALLAAREGLSEEIGHA
jgi:hypothetical protein